MREESKIDDAYLRELDAQRRWADLLHELEMDIERFEKMPENEKDRPVTERDIYQIKLWFKRMFE